MTRNQIQSKAIKLSQKYPNLFLEWATGTGKTKAALDIVSKLPGRGYIVLAETSHKTNWMEDIVKHKHEDILGRSTIVLYASIHKLANTEIDWVIYDEVHNATSDKRINAISSINSKNNILLTATLESEQKDLIKATFKNLHTNTITLSQAIEWKLIPEPEINIIPIKLKKTGTDQEIILTKGAAKKRIKLSCTYNERWQLMKKHKDIELTIPCSQQQKYNWLNEQIDYWRDLYFRKRLEWQKAKWLQMTIQRKRFLAEIKTPYALEIVHKLQRAKTRFICFAGSVNQAKILGSKNNVVHSENKDSQNIINNFNNTKLSNIFAVGMLQEGVNLTNIEAGLIVQLDAKTRRYTQKAGRMFRGKKPIQYIIYVKDTRDEEFLNNVLEGLEKYVKNE